MRLSIPGFDLARTAESGQCFRLLPDGDKCWRLIAYGKRLSIKDLGGHLFQFSCTRPEFETIWQEYFDLGRDYGAIHALLSPEDGYLHKAAAFSRGLRILRQEPFETLISFIISQRKTVGAIRHCVNLLCEKFGERIGDDAFAFPTPKALTEASLDELLACALGYRARYIQQASRMVLEGRPDLEALRDQTDEALLQALLTLPGVGLKVASCVMLFAYHRMDAFPVDVWIERVLKSEFPQGFPFERFPGSAGIIQQFLFCYARERGRGKLAE